MLLEALATLKKAGTPMRAVLIGNGPIADFLASATTRLGLIEDVVWLGAQPPSVVHQQLQACDIFCLPSFAEGLPVVLMEAMAVNDGELRNQVVKAGRTRVEAMHNINLIAMQLVDLFASNVPALGR